MSCEDLHRLSSRYGGEGLYGLAHNPMVKTLAVSIDRIFMIGVDSSK